jgi:hypothetical protein
MATIIGVITDGVREGWSKYHATAATGFSDKIFGGTFKIGEGGWVDVPPKVPKSPDPSLTDLDCVINPGSYPVDSRYVFGPKAFHSITWVSPSVIRLECLLDFTEANDDGFGNPPEFWELGVYDSAGNMVAYFTFPVEIKTVLNQLLFEVDIIL